MFGGYWATVEKMLTMEQVTKIREDYFPTCGFHTLMIGGSSFALTIFEKFNGLGHWVT